jgi:DNA-binding LytR/AlgR family response regulator
MRIGICEDEEIYRKLVSDRVSAFFQGLGEAPALDVFSDGAPFLQAMRKGLRYDLLLLDLQLEKSDGMEIAEQVREMDQRVPIIFVTGMESRAVEGYGVAALDYVVKSQLDQRLEKALERCWKKRQEASLLFETSEGEAVILSFQSILWVESENRGVKIVTAEREYHNPSLAVGKVVEKLPTEIFVEIHKSVYVRIEEIRRIGADNVIMSNNVSLPMSRRKRKEVMGKVLKTMKGKMA